MPTATPDLLPSPESAEGMALLDGYMTPAEQQLRREYDARFDLAQSYTSGANIIRDGTSNKYRKLEWPEGVTTEMVVANNDRLSELVPRINAMEKQRATQAQYRVAEMPPIVQAQQSGLHSLRQDMVNGRRAVQGAMEYETAAGRLLHSPVMQANGVAGMPVRIGSDITDDLFPLGTGGFRRLMAANGERMVQGAGELTTTTWPAQRPTLGYVRAPGFDYVHYQLVNRVPESTMHFSIPIQTTRANVRGTTGPQINNQGETEAAAQSEIARTRYDYHVHRTSRYHKITVEQSMDDASAEREIRRDLFDMLHESVSVEVLRGAGTSNTSHGITNATGWPSVHHIDWSVATARVSATAYPNDTELRNLVFQVMPQGLKEVRKVGKGMASAVTCTHEIDQMFMGLVTDEGAPVWVHPTAPMIRSFHGVPIFPSDEFVTPANDAACMTICDWNWVELHTWGEVELDMGMIGDDLIEYMRTILAGFWNVLVLTRQQAVSVIDWHTT